jgi:hypothetical protein
MKTRITVAAVFIAIAIPAVAAEEKKPDAAQQTQASGGVEYKPPTRGAPRVRVGGSTRSMARALSLAVIAPDHTGLAATDQPELFWYISRAVESPLEFTLVAVDATDPLVETAIAPVSEPGIQRIRLADYGVKLKPGEEYQWLISFASKPGSRAKDAIASGRVRVQPVAMKGASYATYAQAGYWYDAFASLRTELTRRPRDAALAAAQQALLEQVGLGEVARSEAERLTGRK